MMKLHAEPSVIEPDDDSDDSFVAQVTRACGADAAQQLCQAFGGTSQYFPSDPQPHHVVVKVMGLKAAKQFARQIGFGDFMVPLGSEVAAQKRRTTILQLKAERRPVREIARIVGCHSRTVERVCSAAGKARPA